MHLSLKKESMEEVSTINKVYIHTVHYFCEAHFVVVMPNLASLRTLFQDIPPVYYLAHTH